MSSSGTTKTCVRNESPLLSEMCIEEARSIMLTKCDYDMAFPEHKKKMSSGTVLQLARAAVVQRLSDPEGSDDSLFESDHMPYFDETSS